MKRMRFSEEQIIAILKEHEAGVATADLCRKHGMSSASFYAWKAKYGGMDVAGAEKLKGLGAENAKLGGCWPMHARQLDGGPARVKVRTSPPPPPAPGGPLRAAMSRGFGPRRVITSSATSTRSRKRRRIRRPARGVSARRRVRAAAENRVRFSRLRTWRGIERSASSAAIRLAPLLLEDDGANVFMIDPKGGEGAQWSALFRNALHDGDAIGVEILDPCGVFPDIASQALNPLDVINPANPNFIADADKLAEALVPDENAKDPFWARAGRKVVRALMVHVATASNYHRRSLLEVQDAIARGPDDAFLEEMAGNPVAEGLVARDAATISSWKNAEGMWQGIKAQVDASLMFLDLPGVRRTLAQTDFNVRDLRRRRKSLYVVIPNKEKESMGRWLRLIYTSVMDQIDAEPGRDVHVVVDEFAALGKFDRVLTDLATLRSAGFRYHIAIQDLNQLNELYGHGWQTIIGNCAVRQFLGVNDNFTAEYLSHALGTTTVQDGWDYQQEFADGPQTKRPRWVARPLRTPSEILGTPREEMIILTDRTRPFLLPKCHYFDTDPWLERAHKLCTGHQEQVSVGPSRFCQSGSN